MDETEIKVSNVPYLCSIYTVARVQVVLSVRCDPKNRRSLPGLLTPPSNQ